MNIKKCLILGTVVLITSVYSADARQCMGITKKGARCKNPVAAGESYCHLHKGQSYTAPKAQTVVTPPPQRPTPAPEVKKKVAAPQWFKVTGVTNGVDVVFQGGKCRRLAGVLSDNRSNAQTLAACGSEVLMEVDTLGSGLYLWNRKGECVNVEIVRDGHARVISGYAGKMAEVLKAAEKSAKIFRTGKWAEDPGQKTGE